MGVLDASRECRVRTGIAAVQILLDDLEHAFSCRDKTDDAHRVDFGLDTERRLGLTSRGDVPVDVELGGQALLTLSH